MIRKDLVLFLIIGFLTVLVDYLTYRTVVVTGLFETYQAKVIGFVTGTIFSYVANRSFTFGAQTHARGSGKRFTILYALTLLINISVNALMLRVLCKLQNPVWGAFLIATGLSAAINFIGMKHFVFIRARPVETP